MTRTRLVAALAFAALAAAVVLFPAGPARPVSVAGENASPAARTEPPTDSLRDPAGPAPFPARPSVGGAPPTRAPRARGTAAP